MKNRGIVSLILLASLIMIAGCVNQTATQSESRIKSQDQVLVHGTWHLTDVEKNSGFSSIYPGTTITLTIFPDGTVNGSAGCNTYSGLWSTQGNSMNFAPFSMTKKICDDTMAMTVETRYIRLLQETATYSVSEKTLNLTGDSASVLVFSRAE